jgi:hypothetical protein
MTYPGRFSASYDNEDRVQTRTYSAFGFGTFNGGASGTDSFTWGLNGHPALLSRGSPVTLHWDGDDALFASYVISGTTAVCTFVEREAQCGNVIDRDLATSTNQVRNATLTTGLCTSAMFPSDGGSPSIPCANPSSTQIYYEPADLAYVNSDGLSWAPPLLGLSGGVSVVFQGTRTFNPGTSQCDVAPIIGPLETVGRVV